MAAEWTPAPYSLPLDDLYATDPPHHFLHNDIIYVDVLRSEPAPHGLCDVVVPRGAAMPHRLLGSTVVTRVLENNGTENRVKGGPPQTRPLARRDAAGDAAPHGQSRPATQTHSVP